jgi:hypothetical protein
MFLVNESESGKAFSAFACLDVNAKEICEMFKPHFLQNDDATGFLVPRSIDEEGEIEHAKRIISEWLRQKENSIVKCIMELDPSLKEEYVRRVLRKISYFPT